MEQRQKQEQLVRTQSSVKKTHVDFERPRNGAKWRAISKRGHFSEQNYLELYRGENPQCIRFQ